MTFLNPLLLFGLVAASLPLLIHLLNLRKLKTVEFSSLRFLKELQKTQIRRVRIQQILLLILRTLLVIFVVLAFSRPAVKGDLAGTIGSRAKSTMVILLDDSPSMSVRNERGVIFTQARDRALDLLQLVGEGDEVYFVKLSDCPLEGQISPWHSAAAAREAISGTEVSPVRSSFEDGIGTVARILSESENVNREIYILSDAQRSQFISLSSDTTAIFSEAEKLFFIQVAGMTEIRNLGVSGVSAEGQVITPGPPVSFEMRLENGGTLPVENSLASFYLDGSRVAQQSVSLPAGNFTTTTVRVVPKRKGILRGYIDLEDDAFSRDNRRYFTLEVPEKIGIALVGPPDATRYIALALSAVEGLGGEGLFEIEDVEESRLTSVDFAPFDAIIMSDVGLLRESSGQRVAQFVEGGGGLAVFPGRRTDLPNINNVLFSAVNIPPASLRGDLSDSDQESERGHSSFGTIDYAHPIFSGLFEANGGTKTVGSVESPEIRKHVLIDPGLAGNNLVELSNGDSFMSDYRFGSGRILLFAVDAATHWSDFPLKGLFAPLLHRSVLYLTSDHASTDETIVGSPVSVRMRLRDSGGSHLMITPDGITERVEPHVNPVTGLTAFTSPRTRETGHYNVVMETDPVKILGTGSVNIDPHETALQTAGKDEMNRFFGSSGLDERSTVFVSVEDEIIRTVRESRFGIELWKHMLALAIAFALAEMAVARVTRRDQTAGETTG